MCFSESLNARVTILFELGLFREIGMLCVCKSNTSSGDVRISCVYRYSLYILIYL